LPAERHSERASAPHWWSAAAPVAPKIETSTQPGVVLWLGPVSAMMIATAKIAKPTSTAPMIRVSRVEN